MSVNVDRDSNTSPFLVEYAKLEKAVTAWEDQTREKCNQLRTKIHAPEVMKKDLRIEIGVLKYLEKAKPLGIFNDCQRDGNVNFSSLETSQIQKIQSVFVSRIQSVLQSVKEVMVEAKGKIEEIDQNPENIEKLWYSFWHGSKDHAALLNTHKDFVLFLKDSRLIFPLQGYRQSSHHLDLKEGIRLDGDKKHPMLLVEGKWVRWDALQDQDGLYGFHYDKKLQKILDKDGKIWSYSFFPKEGTDKAGLIPHDRYGILKPVHELSTEEHARVKQQAARFYQTNLDPKPNEDKPYVIQFFTTQRQMRQGLWRNFDATMPSHTGMRIIGPGGECYSVGYEIPTPQNKNVTGSGLPWTFAYSEDVEITSQDYDEFTEFAGRYVTSIPATQSQGDDILKYIEGLIGKPKTFQYVHQNCTRFARQITDMLGVTPKEGFFQTLGGWLWDSLPSLEDIPVIGGVLAKIANVVKAVWRAIKKYTPTMIKVPVVFIAEAVAWLPRKFFTVLRNIVILVLGGAKGYKLPEGVKNDRDNQKNLTAFSPLLQNWYDIFNEDIGFFDFPGTFRTWQKEQPSTYLHKYSGPQYYIVPDQKV